MIILFNSLISIKKCIKFEKNFYGKSCIFGARFTENAAFNLFDNYKKDFSSSVFLF